MDLHGVGAGPLGRVVLLDPVSRTGVLGGVGPARVVGLEAVRVLRSGARSGLPGLLVRLAGLGWLVGGGLCALLAPASGEASAETLGPGDGVSSASAVVPVPPSRSPSASAAASRLRRARNEVCVTVIVRTVLTHEG